MVKKLGVKRFKERDKWLNESFEQDEKLWEKNPKIKEALVKAIIIKENT